MNLINDYLAATKNEVAIDIASYKLLNINPSDWGFLPRPTKWYIKYQSNGTFIKFVSFFLKVFWRYLGSYLFYSAELIRFALYRARLDDCADHAKAELEYGLAFSARAIDVIHPRSKVPYPSCWITFPWVDISELPDTSRHYDIFSFLSFNDLLRAFKLSGAATYHYASNKETKCWVLQTYTAFRWFAVRIALEKLNGGHFFIAEHYDRWAVLIDSLVYGLKYDSPLAGNKKSTMLLLVQHGALVSLSDAQPSEIPAMLHFDLPYRLNAVDRIYVYDDYSSSVFLNDVLSIECIKSGLETFFYKPLISLKPTIQKGILRVLFVGHPICENLHIKLYSLIKNEFKLDVYYKPHPTSKISQRLGGIDWHIISGRCDFPEVDILISYPSTLVSEYHLLGVPAVTHPINENIYNLQEIITEVREAIIEQEKNINSGSNKSTNN